MATVVETLLPSPESIAPTSEAPPAEVVNQAPAELSENQVNDIFELAECWARYLEVNRIGEDENTGAEDFNWEHFKDGVAFTFTVRSFIKAPQSLEELQQEIIRLLRDDADTLEYSLGVHKKQVDAFAVVDTADDRILGIWLDEAGAKANLDGVRRYYGGSFGKVCPISADIVLDAKKGGAQ